MISFAFLVALVALGLASRRFDHALPHPIRKRTGDALWATAAFAGIGLLRPRWSTTAVAVAAIAVSFADEFSQMYHAPWIDRIRARTLGHLFLGQGFSKLDLVAYAVGVAVALPVDVWWTRRAAGPSERDLADSACFPPDVN